MHNFKELKVWQKTIEFALELYNATSDMPTEERFGLVSQMRRCSVSIASNIAEGAGRDTKEDFSKFLSISLGSCFELETQLLISEKLNFIESGISEILLNNLSEIQKMLYSLKRSMQ